MEDDWVAFLSDHDGEQRGIRGNRALTVEKHAAIRIEERQRQQASPVRAHESLTVACPHGESRHDENSRHYHHGDTGGEVLAPTVGEMAHGE